jgi:hypothetical protein
LRPGPLEDLLEVLLKEKADEESEERERAYKSEHISQDRKEADPVRRFRPVHGTAG